MESSTEKLPTRTKVKSNRSNETKINDLFTGLQFGDEKIVNTVSTHYSVSGGPIIRTSHLYISLSSIRPAENPSTGFLCNSGKKKFLLTFQVEHMDVSDRGQRGTRLCQYGYGIRRDFVRGVSRSRSRTDSHLRERKTQKERGGGKRLRTGKTQKTKDNFRRGKRRKNTFETFP